MSLPTRERGLKYGCGRGKDRCPVVAPYAGAWIEMSAIRSMVDPPYVAPYAGAWIEI